MRTRTSSVVLTIAAAVATGDLHAAMTHALHVPAQAQPDAAGAVERGTKALARARAAYASLKSYSDSFEVGWEWKAEDHPVQKTTMKGATIWVAPNKLRLAGNTSSVICDGSTLILHDTAVSKYVRHPQPAAGDEVQDALAENFPQLHWLMDPAAAILMRGDANPEMLLRMIKKVTSSEPQVRDGVPGLEVLAEGMADLDDPTIATPAKVTLWFRDSDGLLGHFGLDTTEASNERGGAVYESALWRCTMTNITTNADVPGDTFAFTPGPSDEESDVLAETIIPDFPEGAGGSQNQLIGSPAPALGAPDLEGKSVTLEEYRGRVVVLDFWATWCGPCVAAIPHVQKLSEQYADKPVTVLGINQDRGDTERVQKFIADKKITFRQVMDEGQIGTGYRVRGIPCTVLIDKEGVVQDVHVGFNPGSEKEIATKIDRLLEGKPVHTPEEIENFRKEAEREANRPALAFPAEKAERLTDAGRVGQGFFHRYQSQTIDIDGDGKPEVVTPSENALQYIDETGQSVKTIRLRGMGGHVNSFHPVRLNGKTHWLIAMMEYGAGADQSTTIGFFDDTGKKLWTCRPKSPGQSFVQASLAAGDLTGDGVPELVVGLEATRRDDSGDLEFDPKGQAGAVLVLDREGNTLVQRAFKEQVGLVFVGVPAKPGEPAFVTVVTDQRVQKLKLDLNAKGETMKKEITP